MLTWECSLPGNAPSGAHTWQAEVFSDAHAAGKTGLMDLLLARGETRRGLFLREPDSLHRPALARLNRPRPLDLGPFRLAPDGGLW